MGLLAMGAGAGKGLDQFLQQLLAEQAQQERQRASMADEKLRGQQIDSAGKDRELAQKSLDANREASQENQAADNVRANIQLRPAGNNVSEAAHSYETKHGAPEDLYKLNPTVADPEAVKRGAPEALAQNKDPVTFKFGGTKTTTPGPVNAEVKTVIYKGKPVDADYDPRTKTYTYKGQDITQDQSHYEKPPAPDRVLIQSGDSYVPRSDAAAKIRAGEQVPLATTSATRTMGEGARMLEPHIKAVSAQAAELDKAGLFGPVMSRVQNALVKAGTIDEFAAMLEDDPELGKDKLAGKFATSLGLLASGAGRVHGGARGGGSSTMITYFKALLSNASTLDMFLGRLDGLDDFMSGYATGPGGSKPAAGAAPATGGGRRLTYDPATGTLK